MRNQKEEAVKQNASVGYLLCCVLIGLLFLLFCSLHQEKFVI